MKKPVISPRYERFGLTVRLKSSIKYISLTLWHRQCLIVL